MHTLHRNIARPSERLSRKPRLCGLKETADAGVKKREKACPKRNSIGKLEI
jgi:hypothetical protein